MTKVFHVISDTNIGGAGIWLLNFIRHVDRNDFDIRVILPGGSKLRRLVEDMGITVYEFDNMSNQSFDRRVIGDLKRLFKKERPDIVHTHASVSARVAGRLAGVKNIINTKHCIDELGDQTAIKKSIKGIMNRMLSNKMIAVCEAAKLNMMQQGIPDSKIEVVHNGIEPLQEMSKEQIIELKNKYGIDEDKLIVGNIARLEEIKGQIYFIDAAKKILETNENVVFLMVGTGSLKDELKKKIDDYGISDKVFMIGYVEDIYKIFNIIDINVISSLSEAFCLSILEGMSLGVPAVGTDSGGTNEIIINKTNGYLVPPRDSNSLATNIKKLLDNDKLREQMGSVGKKLILNKFTSVIMVKNIEKIYKQLV